MDSESKDPVKNESSFTEKFISLLQRLLHDIWTSPINLLLVALILCLLVRLFLLKRKSTNATSQKQTPVHLPKMSKRDLTVQELRGYNGIESNGRILTAIHGDIFDVSQRSDLYGIGGSYSLFAGRDATRALSKMQLDPSLFSNEYDDLADLTDKERSTARNWHEDFREKYDIVGRLLRSGEKPTVYPTEDTTDAGGYNLSAKKRE
jgi:membrane-associated progesterone receptor component